MTMDTAYFVKQPFRIQDLIRLHVYRCRQPFMVEKVVELSKIDFENFITDFTVDRWYIEKNKRLCRIDSKGVWHCILVRRRGWQGGVLVMPDGADYPKYAAYCPEKEAEAE